MAPAGEGLPGLAAEAASEVAGPGTGSPAEARGATTKRFAADPSAPLRQIDAQVMHKRAYGNRLFFVDVEGEEAIAAGEGRGLEIVFSFEAYGSDVRLIRKDINVGDVIHFEGRFRSCGRILDAISYVMVRRWSEAGGGLPFRPPEAWEPARGSRARAPPPPAGDQDAKTKRFCKFWISNGTCQRANCPWEHPEGEALKAARGEHWEAQKRRRAEVANPDDPHRREDKMGHAKRAGVLAEWLCRVYGEEALRARGVVEIAGGRGDLAFELSVKRGVPCTVVDPRCPGGHDPVGPWAGWHLSRQQRTWLEASDRGLHGIEECQAHVLSCPLQQCKASAPTDWDAAEPATRLWWAQVVGGCRVVVGLHPDQATGSVLQLARAFGLPFAVVPCCTFADDFPSRRLADGRPVRTYDDLVQWLRSQDEGTEVDFLGFHGKANVRGDITQAEEPAAS